MTETATLETTLALHVEQVLDGDATCDYCPKDARWMIGTGADPEPAPHCHAHASQLIVANGTFVGRFAELGASRDD